MREMKNSGIEWIGEIPMEFDVVPLKYEFQVLDDQRKPIAADKRNRASDNLYPYYGASGQIDEIDGYTLDDDVLLIGEDGANLLLRNLPLIYQVHGKAWINNHAHILKPKVSTNYMYAFYMLESLDITNYISGSAQPKLNQQALLNMPVITPPLDEQNSIANYLDKKCSEIDAITKDIQTQIDTLEQYKRSVITEAVTKGLDPDVEMKDSGIEWIGEIPRHWNIMANRYLMHKEKNICPIYTGEDILSLTMNGVIVRDLDAGGKMPTSFDGYQRLYPGNLLMCLFDIDVTPRCIGLIKQEGLSSPAYSQFILNSNADPSYYCYYYTMLDNDKTLLHLAKNLRHSLTEDQLGAIPTIAPPLLEQKRIADFLDQKCSEIELVKKDKQSQIKMLIDYKKSLIYEYVTGKKEVPVE